MHQCRCTLSRASPQVGGQDQPQAREDFVKKEIKFQLTDLKQNCPESIHKRSKEIAPTGNQNKKLCPDIINVITIINIFNIVYRIVITFRKNYELLQLILQRRGPGPGNRQRLQ